MRIDRPDGVNAPSHATRFEKVDTAGGPIVLCNPTRPQVRRLRQTGMKADGDMGLAYETLLIDTCVQPTGNELMKLLDEWPGVALDPNVIAAMNRLAGITNEEAGKY